MVTKGCIPRHIIYLLKHSPKRYLNNGFAKQVFFFFGADKLSSCVAVINSKGVNLGHGQGIHVPCKSHPLE